MEVLKLTAGLKDARQQGPMAVGADLRVEAGGISQAACNQLLIDRNRLGRVQPCPSRVPIQDVDESVTVFSR